jgi:hypothetical protein
MSSPTTPVGDRKVDRPHARRRFLAGAVTTVAAAGAYGATSASPALAAGSDIINIEDHGASTGSSDNTSSIQDAIDDGITAGKPVYVPPGTFVCTGTLQLADSTDGELHVFFGEPGLSVLEFDHSTAGSAIELDSDSVVDGQIRLFGLTVAGASGSTPDHGLRIVGSGRVDDLTVDTCVFAYLTEAGISGTSGSSTRRFEIRHSGFHDISWTGNTSSGGASAVVPPPSEDLGILDCSFWNFGAGSTSDWAVKLDTAEAARVVGNVFRDCRGGVLVTGSTDVTITANAMSDLGAREEIYILGSQGFAVVDNTLEGPSAKGVFVSASSHGTVTANALHAVTGQGVVVGQSSQVCVADNTIDGDSGSRALYLIGSESSPPTEHVVVTGNTISGTWTSTAVHLNGDYTTDVTLADNHVDGSGELRVAGGSRIAIVDNTLPSGTVALRDDPADCVVVGNRASSIAYEGTDLRIEDNLAHASLFTSGSTDSNNRLARNWEPTDPVVNDQTANYTLGLGDDRTTVRLDATSGVTVTVPAHTTTQIPVGTTIRLVQANIGQITVAAAGSVTVDLPGDRNPKTRARHSVLELLKTADDTWQLTGDLEVV